MLKQRWPWMLLLGLLLISLFGCASSPSPGAVVEAPQVKRPPPPSAVTLLPAKPLGYFRQQTLDALAK